MQLTLQRARQIAVMAQRLDAERPAGILEPEAGADDEDAVRAELGALAGWLRLDRVEVTRVARL